MDVLAPTPALNPALTLSGPVARTSRPTDPKSIEGVARGFETMFLSLLLKEMRQTLEPGTLFEGDKSDIFGGLFDQMMAEHLSKGNALGIAAMVRKQLERTTHGHDSNHLRAAYAAAPRMAGAALP